MLAAGEPLRYSGALIPTPLARLDSASGQALSSFAPRVHKPGEVRDVLRQPDGRYLVAGVFTEINGSASAYLARLDAGGAVEPAYGWAAAPDNPVLSLALQPDGKVVVGGAFEALGGAPTPGVGRLLPTGNPDPAFGPAFPPGVVTNPVVNQVALEPGGNVLVIGALAPTSAPGNSAFHPVVRLDAQTGQYDRSFNPTYYSPDVLLVQPDGKILLGGRVRVVGQVPQALTRLLPSGADDPAFTSTPAGSTTTVVALALDPVTGQIYTTGSANSTPAVLRFNAAGTREASYAPFIPGAGNFTDGRSLALQPNGRLLVGGLFNSATPFRQNGLVRLLPSGAVDASFAANSGPGFFVNKILVQANGAIVAAGSFSAVGTTPVGGLARLLAAQVLAVGRPQAGAQLAAWPVPAHGVLHLALDAAAGPARVALLDGLGREVRALPAPLPDTSLLVAGLPAGVYWLRVSYAAGPVTRRIVVE